MTSATGWQPARALFRAASLVICGLGLASGPGLAQAQSPYARINAAAASGSITTHQLRGNIRVLEGSGGNIGVLPGPDGILLVDAGIAVSRDKIQAALHSINPGLIRYVIDTHWHWDHTDGNGWLRAAGATVISDRNTVKRLAETIRVVEWEHTFTPIPPAQLPNMIIEDRKVLKFNGEDVLITAYAAGHTDTDLSVYFPKADVMATGDVWWNGYFPFIDYVTGGSIDGAIRSAEDTLARVTDRTQIIPGHGPAGTRAELVAFRDMLVDVRAKVAALKQQGKSLEATIAAHPTADYDQKWGTGVIGPALFTALVYRGV
jgi:glyoxylase-like metal-dependent hydrolase (beta-lactamase superfamily II)